MGAKASKPAQAVGTAARRFPTRSPGSAIPPTTTTTKPATGPSSSRSTKEDATNPFSSSDNDLFSFQQPPPSSPQQSSSSSTSSYDQQETSAAADEDDSPTKNPLYSQRLQQMGIVSPSPTLSNSSTVGRNPSSSSSSSPSYPYSRRSSPSPSPSSSSSSSPFPSSSPSSSSLGLDRQQNQPLPSSAGPHQPIYPSPSSNPVLAALEARSRLVREAESQFENPASDGRGFVDIGTIRQALAIRERRNKMVTSGNSGNNSDAEIERRFRLKPGVLDKVTAGGRRGCIVPLGI